MQVFHFKPGHPPALAGAAEVSGETTGFYWLDIERSETDWHETAQRWLGMRLHERHIQDILNETHPPYYDETDDYDLLVVRALCPGCPPEAPTTRPIAFIVTANAVINVRPAQDPVFGKLHQRFLSTQRQSPTSPAMLLYLLLDQVTDTLFARRDVTSELLSGWQEGLLDRDGEFKDWHALMQLRGQLRRVYKHAILVQHDIDALVQIYFSANSQRTNEILKFLAILSAVFLPLNLVAGLFGMNFVHLPLLQTWYDPWMVAGLMLIIVTGLLIGFRRRRWV